MSFGASLTCWCFHRLEMVTLRVVRLPQPFSTAGWSVSVSYFIYRSMCVSYDFIWWFRRSQYQTLDTNFIINVFLTKQYSCNLFHCKCWHCRSFAADVCGQCSNCHFWGYIWPGKCFLQFTLANPLSLLTILHKSNIILFFSFHLSSVCRKIMIIALSHIASFSFLSQFYCEDYMYYLFFFTAIDQTLEFS